MAYLCLKVSARRWKRQGKTTSMRGMAVQPTRCLVREGAVFSYLLQKPAAEGKHDITFPTPSMVLASRRDLPKEAS
jgi:hypothetical protein